MVEGRGLEFEQVTIRLCTFVILMWCLEGSLHFARSVWVALAGAQRGLKLVKQNRGG